MKQTKAFLPLTLFVVLFMGVYPLPAPVDAIPAVVLALWFAKGTIDERFESFIQGMCLIYLLAGAFSELTKFYWLGGGRGCRFHRFFTELSLASSVTLANLAVANNTVAILICGDFFKEVHTKKT